MPSPLALQYNARLERQRRRLVRAMSRRAERHLRRVAREAAAGYRSGGGNAALAAIDPDDLRLLELLTPQYTAAAVVAGDNLRRFYGLRGAPQMTSILDAAGQRIVSINGTTREVVREQLRVALRRGLTNQDTERLIRGAVGEMWRAERIARTETAYALNEASAQVYESGNVDQVEIFDGAGCGWTSHNDPLLANGRIVSVAEFREYPIAHPNCRRVGSPHVV